MFPRLKLFLAGCSQGRFWGVRGRLNVKSHSGESIVDLLFRAKKQARRVCEEPFPRQVFFYFLFSFFLPRFLIPHLQSFSFRRFFFLFFCPSFLFLFSWNLCFIFIFFFLSASGSIVIFIFLLFFIYLSFFFF